MFHKLIRNLAPVAALAIAAMAGGCDRVNFSINGSDGVPLAELDQSGPPPEELVLAGPDNVVIKDGKALKIAVSGDQGAIDALRFTLKDGTLGIMREHDSGKDKGIATVNVTMPSPRAITLAGSGNIDAASMAGEAEVTIAGSGAAKIGKIDSSKLDLTIAGSGNIAAAGTVDTLDLTVAGSGSAAMADLKVDTADITIAGTGNAEFTSDGKVEANIMGSGSVTVVGRAECTISAMGSGSLNCRDGTVAKKGRPVPPAPPKAPPAPDAPEAPATGE